MFEYAIVNYCSLRAAELTRKQNSQTRGTILDVMSHPLSKIRESGQIKKTAVEKREKTKEQWKDLLKRNPQFRGQLVSTEEKASTDKKIVHTPTPDEPKRNALFYKRHILQLRRPG